MELLEPYAASTLVFLTFAAFLGGLARGFSGFGAALIFIPLASSVISPRIAAPILLVVDLVLALGFIPRAWPKSTKREVFLISSGALIGIPIGTWLLTRADPIAIRWMIVGLILPLLALLICGWRYHGQPHATVTIGTGITSGFLNGIAQVGGPPVVLYWLGSAAGGDLVRANIISYFAISSCITATSYLLGGLLTSTIFALSAICGPSYGIGLYLGSHMFGIASETTFRRACYGLIAGACLVSLPVFDHVLR